MGAHSLLQRRVGERMARLLIEDGKSRSADEMHELGLVDIVCEPGEGEAALAQVRRATARGRFATDLALKRARQRTDLLSKAELIDIVDMWVELALDLGETELRRMDCLARHQERRRAHSLIDRALASASPAQRRSAALGRSRTHPPVLP